MVYFHTYDDKMVVYIPNGNHVVQRIKDKDNREYNYTISLEIFEQLKGDLRLWEIKV